MTFGDVFSSVHLGKSVSEKNFFLPYVFFQIPHRNINEIGKAEFRDLFRDGVKLGE